MATVKVLFLILLWKTSFLHNEAGLVVFAPSPHRAQLGENFVLPCSFKVDDPSINIQFFATLWLFQGNEVLRLDNKGTLSQPRMSINQQDITKGIANMEIRNVTLSDIGKYRCIIIYSPQKEFKDIDLSVYATPLVKIEKVKKEDKTSSALCSVMGFYPRNISVEILMDGTIMEDSVLSEHRTNADGTYSVNKTWTIPTDVSPKMLSCSVRHETLSPSVQKDLQLGYEAFLHNEAGLVVFAPSPHRAQLGENFVLPCSFKVDDPSIIIQFFATLWLFQGNEVLRLDNKGTVSQPRMSINQQDITKGIANMEIRNVTLSDIGKYRCIIIYSPQKKFKDIDLTVYGKYYILYKHQTAMYVVNAPIIKAAST
ncbi:natural cytotoxicity triggering receptor 3 ligand 1-like [Aquarana catesbeiana]|uniref:natural cytotoxicity triggering receptor 3 ligand 1-like n=1 Tax=Aquarana catesbeiana TaxID=8400 RepID=UPI003CC98D92